MYGETKGMHGGSSEQKAENNVRQQDLAWGQQMKVHGQELVYLHR